MRPRDRAKFAVAPIDKVGAALGGAGTTPETPTYLEPALDIPLKQDSAVARRQDALGAMLWRTLNPDLAPREQPARDGLEDVSSQSVVVVAERTFRLRRLVPEFPFFARRVWRATLPLARSTLERVSPPL